MKQDYRQPPTKIPPTEREGFSNQLPAIMTLPDLRRECKNKRVHHTISFHIMSCHIISYNIVSYYILIISYHTARYPIISYHIASHHTASLTITQHHIAPRRFLGAYILLTDTWHWRRRSLGCIPPKGSPRQFSATWSVTPTSPSHDSNVTVVWVAAIPVVVVVVVVAAAAVVWQ